MQRKRIYDYYAFGYNYGILKRDGLEGRKKDDAVSLIEGFFKMAGELDLTVTAQVADPLSGIAEDIKKADGDVVSKEIADTAAAQLERIDPALDAELSLRFAFVMTKKRYPLETLLGDQASLLAKDVYGRLSDSTKRDIVHACVQIALSQPTAASFHLMRAIEQQVRVLYRHFKRTKRLKVELWGPMTDELKKKNKPKPPKKLLDHLDSMRINFRNPTQHPETFYTLDEAQDLLSQTFVAINMIDAALPAQR